MMGMACHHHYHSKSPENPPHSFQRKGHYRLVISAALINPPCFPLCEVWNGKKEEKRETKSLPSSKFKFMWHENEKKSQTH